VREGEIERDGGGKRVLIQESERVSVGERQGGGSVYVYLCVTE